jgi:hypothetical protein
MSQQRAGEYPDAALEPVALNLSPGAEYHSRHRQWQGIPSLDRTANGTLWATWYSGGKTEDADNYVLVVRSEDGGASWSQPVLVVDPPGRVRAYDSNLWTDPLGRLWLCWSQSYEEVFDGRAGVWFSRCDDPSASRPCWSAPRRLCHGVMLNKPTVLSTGEWLFPAGLWAPSIWMSAEKPCFTRHADLAGERFSNVYVTCDQGETFALRGRADIPERVFDEHMIIERGDGSLWLLARTAQGIGESFSTDGGRTWSLGQDSGLGGPNSRFFIRRLDSGNLLLVNHVEYTGRNNLTALLSEDDGRSWPYRLLLDGRQDVSYPDGLQAPDGTIQIIYDHERYGAKEILLASFTEEDVRAGQPASDQCRLQHLVNRAGEEAS